jgi:hypothetical protein
MSHVSRISIVVIPTQDSHGQLAQAHSVSPTFEMMIA